VLPSVEHPSPNFFLCAQVDDGTPIVAALVHQGKEHVMSTGSNQGQAPNKVMEKAEQMGAAAGAAIGRKAGEVVSKAQEAAAAAGHKVQDTAGNVAHKAQEMASQVAERAHTVAVTAAARTDDTLTRVGERLATFAGNLREKAPREGALGSAAVAVADQLQAGGRYLEQHGVNEMAQDLAVLVRRYPLQSLLVGFGVGCLVGMACKRR
jgi:ElaB/YqjD/DUF883 family membrane-anchored ribosome-binding protein